MTDDVIDRIEGATDASDAIRLAKMPLNDLGFAQRFRERFGARVAKTPDAGWLAYDDKRGCWQAGHKGEAGAMRYAHQTGLFIWEEIAAVQAKLQAIKAEGIAPELIPEAEKVWEGLPEQLAKAIDYVGSSGGTNAMLKQAAPYLAAEMKDFDPDTHLLCCTNGTLQPAFIGEPCIVARDVAGRVAGFLPVAKFGDGPEHVGIWPVTRGEGRSWQVGDDTYPQSALLAAPDEVGLDLDAGGTIAHRLYHLDLKLHQHAPEHRITRQAGVAWDPTATCPNWMAHLRTVLADKQDRDFFQRAMGYGLVGSNEAQCFLFLQGLGADGKSTTMKVISRVLDAYARTADPRTFLEAKNRSAADASPDMADLSGDTRLVYTEEPPKGVRINEALLKQITGGVAMRARQLHRDLFDFEPRFLLVMAFNDLPRVSGGDDGFWRRVRLIRFRRQFTLAEQNEAGDMVPKLLKEAPGIFNWMLDGLAAYRQIGLQAHPRMAEDVLQWRSSSDPFGDWWRDRVEASPGGKELNSRLYKDYKATLEEEGVDGRELLGTKAFANRLDSLQIALVKIQGERFRRGVRLKPKDDAPVRIGVHGAGDGGDDE